VAYWVEFASSSVSSVDTCNSTSRMASLLSEGLNVIGGDVGTTLAGEIVDPSVCWGTSVGVDDANVSGPGVGASVRA
jgi:hypothetical protein